jgi:hypothetical protein
MELQLSLYASDDGAFIAHEEYPNFVSPLVTGGIE